MKIRSTKGFLAMLIVLAMAFTAFAGLASADTNQAVGIQEIEAVEAFDSHEKVTIMVRVEGETAYEIKKSVKGIESISEQLLSKQAQVEKNIESVLGTAIDVTNNYVLLFNGFAFDGEYWMIDEINNNIKNVCAYAAPVFDVPKPMLSTSVDLIGGQYAWDLDYTGEGTAIAIIDTGILLSHDMFSVIPENGKIDEDYLNEVVAEYGSLLHAGTNVAQMYKSGKIPFGYNYYFNNYNPAHPGGSDHGTHVAGIAAGDNGDGLTGVAPDAQIVVMQVFQPSGGAGWNTILAALEDCVYLGVDAANMSLGSTAGFSNHESYGADMGRVLDLIDEIGINLSVSSGNEASTAYQNAWGGWQPASDPDSGLTGSPGTFSESLSIASSDNANLLQGYIQLGDTIIGYNDRALIPSQMFITLEGEHEYVVIPSNGYVEDYEGLDVAGKIALVSRGDITFTEKVLNAANAGAIGIIIRDNQPGIINMQVDNYVIPAVSITQANGIFMVEQAGEDGIGTLTVSAEEYLDYSPAANVSSFSSIGPTADLLIKPEITAPGGNIYSSTSPAISGEEYQAWNGTSMSAPHVAGAMAIVKQYVRENFPEASASEVKNLVNAILMNTATQLDSAMVRAQGAGLVNLAAAVSTNAYLSIPEIDRPKLELGENDEGSWKFTVTVNNFGATELTYEVDVQTLTETPSLNGLYARQWYFLTNGTPYDVSDYMTLEAPETVTVPAGGSVDVEFELSATEELKNFCEVYFTSGMYLEGFVKFLAVEDAEGNKDADLSVPFLGFLGDWDYASMFDNYFYYEAATGMDNTMNNGSIEYNYIGYNRDQGIGLNPYADMTGHTFNPDWGAVSPNGDGVYDNVTKATFGLVRNPYTVIAYLEDAAGNKIQDLYNGGTYGWKKDFFNDSTGVYTYSEINMAPAFANIAEGETVYVVIEALLDHADYTTEANELGKWVTPVTVDLTAPSVSVVDGKVNVLDSHYVAYYAIFTDAEFTNCIEVEAGFEMERNVALVADEHTEATLYVLAADYAGNEAFYIVDTATGEVTETEKPGDDGNAPVGEIYYDNSFETQADVMDAMIFDVDGDGEYWGWYNEMAYDGAYALGSQSMDITYVDNFTVFPIAIQEDSTLELAYMGVDGVGEYMTVYVAPTEAISGNTGYLELFEPVWEGSVDNADYEVLSVDVSGYAGYAYVGVRHHNCADGYYLFIDKLRLYTGELGGEGDGFVYPEPDSATTFPTSNLTVDVEGQGYPANGTYEVENGTRFTVFAYPEPGQVVSATINGEPVAAKPGIDGEWYVTATIDAETVIDIDMRTPAEIYTVTINSNEFGTTDPTGEVQVEAGQQLVITMNPNVDYYVSSVLVNGVESVSDIVDGQLTLTIEADTTVDVTFVQIPKTGAVALTTMAVMAIVSGAGIMIFKKK